MTTGRGNVRVPRFREHIATRQRERAAVLKNERVYREETGSGFGSHSQSSSGGGRGRGRGAGGRGKKMKGDGGNAPAGAHDT